MRKYVVGLIPTLGLVVMLVMASVGAAFVYSPATWSKSESHVPTVYNEELVTLTDTSVVVTWVTNIPGDTTILYGVSLENMKAFTLQEETKYHYLELTPLQPGTKYYYMVCTGSYKGRLRSFTTLTPPSGDYLFSFATMNDLHIGRGGKATIPAEQVVEEINQRGAAFIIIKGDITDHAWQKDFETSKAILDNLNEPYYPLMGNHDIWPYGGNEPIGDSIFLKTFKQVLPRDSTYYSFDHEGYRFICIDSVSRDRFPLHLPAARWGGEISDVQMKWLAKELNSAKEKDEKVMIFMHHPCTLEAERTSQLPRFTLDDADATAFRNLISQYDNVVGVFSGHTHRNKVTYASETREMPYPETAATVQYPCGYNIYKVYTGGYIQSFYKCKLLESSETDRVTMTGSKTEERDRLGDIEDRNFVYTYTPLERDDLIAIREVADVDFLQGFDQSIGVFRFAYTDAQVVS